MSYLKLTLAMVLIPAATVPASASIVFNTIASGYTLTPGAPDSASLTVVALPGASVTGVNAFGTSSFAVTPDVGYTYTAFASGNGTGTLPDGTLNVGWNFTLEVDAIVDPFLISYDVAFTINGDLTSVANGVDFIGPDPESFFDVATLNVTSGAPVGDWEMSIALEFNSGSEPLAVAHFDVATLYIQAEGDPVPEPSPLLLSGPVIGFLIYRVRRRKR